MLKRMKNSVSTEKTDKNGCFPTFWGLKTDK